MKHTLQTKPAKAPASLGAVLHPHSAEDISGWQIRLVPDDVKRYEQSGRWAGQTIWQAAMRFLESSPDRVLVIDSSGRYTLREAMDAARELAGGLHAIGLRPGHVISHQLPNWWEALVLNLAACLSGLVSNPIVPIYRASEVRFILRDARARVLLVPTQFRGFDHLEMGQQLREELPLLSHVVAVRGPDGQATSTFESLRALGRCHSWTAPLQNPNAVKLVIYTSGTTGSPKGVLHTHNTLMSEIHAAVNFWRVGPQDVVIMPSPVTHVTGYLYGLEMPLVAQCSAVLMEKWDAAMAAALIHQHGATLSVGATPFLSELAQHAGRYAGLPSLRVFASGGAPVPPEVVLRAREAFANCAVFRVYGSSEAPTITLGLRPGDDIVLGATTDGRVTNNDVRLHHANSANGEGEVTVRGPEVMVGYTQWADTLEAFDADGYFHTGDLAVLGPEEFLTISGRKKDLIIRGGENISAKEIEDVLHAHPAIADIAVVAMPHARLGEGLCAFVVPSLGHTVGLAEINAFLAGAAIARQKYPDRVEIVDALPRTASGKVQKNVLRDRIRALLVAQVNATHEARP